MASSPKGIFESLTEIKECLDKDDSVWYVAGEEKDIKQARRRLSVMSDNKLVEGFADSVNLDDDEVLFNTMPTVKCSS